MRSAGEGGAYQPFTVYFRYSSTAHHLRDAALVPRFLREHTLFSSLHIYTHICIYIFFPSTIERENRDEVLWLGAWVFLEIRRMVGTEIREKRGRIDERGGGRGQRPGRQKGET